MTDPAYSRGRFSDESSFKPLPASSSSSTISLPTFKSKSGKGHKIMLGAATL